MKDIINVNVTPKSGGRPFQVKQEGIVTNDTHTLESFSALLQDNEDEITEALKFLKDSDKYAYATQVRDTKRSDLANCSI